MSCALRVNTATRSTSTSITFSEGQQNGAGVASPLRFLLRGRLRRFVLPVCLLPLRGFDNGRSAFSLSRQRHGAGMSQKPEAPSPSRHRCRVRVVRGNKKTMPDKTPAPAFSLPHTTLRVMLGCCAFCLFIPAHPASHATRGRAALLLSRSPATLPIRPKWLPQ